MLPVFCLPSPVSFDGFVAAWNLTNFPRAFLVSLVVTLVSVTGSILVSSMAAYAIVRNWDRKLFRYAFFYLLAAMFIPFPVVALPQVRLTRMKLAMAFGSDGGIASSRLTSMARS